MKLLTSYRILYDIYQTNDFVNRSDFSIKSVNLKNSDTKIILKQSMLNDTILVKDIHEFANIYKRNLKFVSDKYNYFYDARIIEFISESLQTSDCISIDFILNRNENDFIFHVMVDKYFPFKITSNGKYIDFEGKSFVDILLSFTKVKKFFFDDQCLNFFKKYMSVEMKDRCYKIHSNNMKHGFKITGYGENNYKISKCTKNGFLLFKKLIGYIDIQYLPYYENEEDSDDFFDNLKLLFDCKDKKKMTLKLFSFFTNYIMRNIKNMIVDGELNIKGLMDLYEFAHDFFKMVNNIFVTDLKLKGDILCYLNDFFMALPRNNYYGNENDLMLVFLLSQWYAPYEINSSLCYAFFDIFYYSLYNESKETGSCEFYGAIIYQIVKENIHILLSIHFMVDIIRLIIGSVNLGLNGLLESMVKKYNVDSFYNFIYDDSDFFYFYKSFF